LRAVTPSEMSTSSCWADGMVACETKISRLSGTCVLDARAGQPSIMLVRAPRQSPTERRSEGIKWARRSILDEIAGTSIGGVLVVIAAVRRGKPVHPTGVVYDARLVVSGSDDAPRGARLLCELAEHRAIVRFSRSLGLPRPVPDLLGVSIRVLEPYGPGRHQDFLLVTSVDRPVLHHLFVPAVDAQQRPYSSSLPYRAG